MNYMNQSRGNCSSPCSTPAGNNRQSMDSGCKSCNPRNGGSRCGNNNMNSRCDSQGRSSVNPRRGNACGNMPSRCGDCDANSSSRNDPLEGMPLGIGYVPWQQWRNTYDYSEGLSQGTIFPCLNLPFYGCIPRDFRYNQGGRA